MSIRGKTFASALKTSPSLSVHHKICGITFAVQAKVANVLPLKCFVLAIQYAY